MESDFNIKGIIERSRDRLAADITKDLEVLDEAIASMNEDRILDVVEDIRYCANICGLGLKAEFNCLKKRDS